MKYEHYFKCLVAYNKDKGKYFGLDVEYPTTTPREVDNPYFAEHIFPWVAEEYNFPRVATYYFENSERMARWLDGYVMVGLEINVTSTILPTFGTRIV